MIIMLDNMIRSATPFTAEVWEEWKRAVAQAREEWAAEQRAAGEAEEAASIVDVKADIDPSGR